MKSTFTLLSDDPVEAQEVLAPIFGNLKVTPLSSAYCARICARATPRVAIFDIHVSDSTGNTEPPHDHIGLDLPLTGQFIVTEANEKVSLGRDIYLAMPDRAHTRELRSLCRTLGVTLFTMPLLDDLPKLTGSNASSIPDIGNRIDTAGAVGLMLARNMCRLWSESNRQPEAGAGSGIAIAELEDELITNFVMGIEALSNSRCVKEGGGIHRAMARAEEFLDSHRNQAVSRANLADAAGVSIRTLSRAFLKRHGTGPMGFLKARRLNASYRQLFTADAGSTSVTEVAVSYGFTHLGKFAMEYKEAFGESPSVTLNR